MPQNKSLHIVSFHYPYPPDYGGIIDVYYKIKALHESGVQVILHTFTEKPLKNHAELEKITTKIYVYQRKSAWFKWIEGKPYSVYSRFDKQLIKNLTKDNTPILLEGLQTTAILDLKALSNKKVYIRMHNIEWIYYRELARYERNIFRKAYQIRESFLLKNHEKNILHKAEKLLCISEREEVWYSTNYLNSKTSYIPPFHGFENTMNNRENNANNEKFALYHGNLSIAENEFIAGKLVEISNDCNIPIILAGKNPSNILLSKVKAYPNAKIISNPEDKLLHKLMIDAHIQVIASAQGTGVKLKTIGALFTAKWIISNENGLPDAKSADYCTVENDFSRYAAKINELAELEYPESLLQQRLEYARNKYSNQINAQNLINAIFE